MAKNSDLVQIGTAAAAIAALLVLSKAYADPTPTPTPTPVPTPSPSPTPTPTPTPALPQANAVKVYVPVYSDAMAGSIVQAKSNGKYPNLPIIAAFNPGGGPGDEYEGVMGRRSDVGARLTSVKQLPNVYCIGYIPTWYAGVYASPPQAESYAGSPKYGVRFYMNESDYLAYYIQNDPVRKALWLPDLVDNYRLWYPEIQGLMMDEVYNGNSTGTMHTNRVNFYTNVNTTDPNKYSLIGYAKSKGMNYFKGNPGGTTANEFFDKNRANNFNVLSVSERGTGGLPATTPAGLTSFLRGINGNGARRWQCAITWAGAPTLTQAQTNAVCAEVDSLFITSASYTAVGTYFDNLCNWVDQYNKSIGAY